MTFVKIHYTNVNKEKLKSYTTESGTALSSSKNLLFLITLVMHLSTHRWSSYYGEQDSFLHSQQFRL